MTRFILILAFSTLAALGANFWQWSSHSKTKYRLELANKAVVALVKESERNAKLAAEKTKALLAIQQKQRETLNELERLKHEDPEVKSWADKPLPDGVKRLLNQDSKPRAEPSDIFTADDQKRDSSPRKRRLADNH